MPTFDLNRRHLLHFAGYAHHVGLYPAPVELEDLEQDLKPYRSGKASLRFPLGRSLPVELIRRPLRLRLPTPGPIRYD